MTNNKKTKTEKQNVVLEIKALRQEVRELKEIVGILLEMVSSEDFEEDESGIERSGIHMPHNNYPWNN